MMKKIMGNYYMTSAQLINLNTNLKPTLLINLNDLLTDNTTRNKLVLFFYKLKNNYDKYQNGLSVCSVKINWEITTTITLGVLNFNTNDNIPGVLASDLYKYILRTEDTNLFIAYIKEALRIDSLLKKKAYRYFNEKNCCDNLTISNYNQYYFMQHSHFIGNR